MVSPSGQVNEPGDTAVPGAHSAALYYPVSPRKFVVLSLLSLGFYELYWFYMNWSYVRNRDGSDIVPWARALFSPLWYVALLGDLQKKLDHGPIVPGGRLAPAAAYFLISMTWNLPDPLWLISFLTFLPLLPLVHRINAINAHAPDEYALNSRWRFRHLLLATVCLPLLLFTVASGVGLIPSTQVTPGWLVWGPARTFLVDSGIVGPNERILYFYSEGILSFEDDGNILTNRRVVSYWKDPESDLLYLDTAFLYEVKDVETQRGSWAKPTVVTVRRHDDSEFILVLSVEGDRDQLFTRKLEESIRPASGQGSSARTH